MSPHRHEEQGYRPPHLGHDVLQEIMVAVDSGVVDVPDESELVPIKQGHIVVLWPMRTHIHTSECGRA